MAPITLVAGILSMFVSQSFAGTFLEVAKVTRKDVELSLLSELAEAVSSQSAGHARIEHLETLLKPMYVAVPKESDGTVSHAVVRYVLNRFFIKNLHWYLHGLEPHGGRFRNSTQQGLEGVNEWIPGYLQNFVGNVIGKQGLTLRDLAILAATLEDFVHKEEREVLQKVYSLLQNDLGILPPKEDTMQVLKLYLALYSKEWTEAAPKEDTHLVDRQEWLTKLLDSKWGPDPDRQIDLEEVATIVKEIGAKYGEFNDIQCQTMKTELISVESRKPGRVKLTDFYKKSFSGPFLFADKIDYLRSFGALDESDPTTPLVIIPNYVVSQSQCLVPSNYYAVCCRNECEDLMGSLEHSIAAAQADPAQIAKLVASIPSSSVQAPRVLSEFLLARLDDVATSNHGQIPLHSRLFAQWMHHAFPRECPYPRIGMEASPQTSGAWMKEVGEQDSQATQEEMLSWVRSDSCKLAPAGSVECDRKRPLSQRTEQTDSEENIELPWSQVEELLVVRPTVVPSTRSTQLYLLDLVFYIILFSAVSLVLWISKDALAPRLPMSKKPDHSMV